MSKQDNRTERTNEDRGNSKAIPSSPCREFVRSTWGNGQELDQKSKGWLKAEQLPPHAPVILLEELSYLCGGRQVQKKVAVFLFLIPDSFRVFRIFFVLFIFLLSLLCIFFSGFRQYLFYYLSATTCIPANRKALLSFLFFSFPFSTSRASPSFSTHRHNDVRVAFHTAHDPGGRPLVAAL